MFQNQTATTKRMNGDAAIKAKIARIRRTNIDPKMTTPLTTMIAGIAAKIRPTTTPATRSPATVMPPRTRKMNP